MKENRKYEIHFAPLQGYTDWIFRNAYDEYFGGVNVYYTPFIRIEKGSTFRNKDVRELDPEHNTVVCLVPQILSGTPEEFRLLARFVWEKGYRYADINLGCPFPMVAGKKRGSGMLPWPDRVKEILEIVNEFPEMTFSVKMRLGWEDRSECIALAPIINNVPLCHVTVHARTGKQQYTGEIDTDAFERFYQVCRHPLFYNGDLSTPEKIEQIMSRFPLLKGVALGRGLISSPFLIKDLCEEDLSSASTRAGLLVAFHEKLFRTYGSHLQGEKQLLTKMQRFWDYFLPETDRRYLKKIRKANKITDYKKVVESIFKL